MTKFVDGPAAGVTLALRRSPLFLRVVRSGSDWDALDQVDDTPGPSEALFAYRRVDSFGPVHVLGQDKAGRRWSGWFEHADYAVCDPQPTEATMRSTLAWREWTRARASSADRAAGALEGKS